MILELLRVNHNLQCELDLLKKTNGDLIYKANKVITAECFYNHLLVKRSIKQSSISYSTILCF